MDGLMLSFFLRWLITAVSLLITAQIVPGIEIKNFTVALIAAVVLGLINAIIRPLLILFTLPLTILTLGLFIFVVNAISFSLVAIINVSLFFGDEEISTDLLWLLSLSSWL